ncbi:transcriptional regulator [Candidatus Saccharibacteria bacterium]|nr:transcriptional regulator [Candidatus Saccharibacteria bacterium]
MALHNVDTVAIYRALGDEIRLGMVKKIANADGLVASCTVVSSCSSLLTLSQPTISHHFAKLVSSGVLVERKQGTQKLYELDYEALQSAGVDINKIIS